MAQYSYSTGAAERRQTREAQKRARELERRNKELAKLSQLEQARLEVETYENRLEVLLSVHKEQGEAWDWSAISATLDPPPPQRQSLHELKAKLRLASTSSKATEWEREIQYARELDGADFQKASDSYTAERTACAAETAVARRIVDGDPVAYALALDRYTPLAEIAELGSTVAFICHSATLVECSLKVNGMDAIPSEVKSLTATGKVSAKAMPRPRFHEIYQDYVCSCVLRVARELFAFLPIETVLITADADLHSSATGCSNKQPVLSVVIQRAVIPTLNYAALDPSDAVEALIHRGDFKATRKSGAFQPITPFTSAEILQETASAPEAIKTMPFEDLLATMRRIRREVQEELDEMRTNPIEPTAEG